MSGPSSFTPSTAVDPTKERDWPAQLGMLDWDSTSIVFTKRSLLEFLKYAGVSVDTNFTNIQKLPRYAQFGKLASGGAPTESSSAPSAATAEQTAASAASDFKPTRRVRDPPGGITHAIFGSAEDSDALSTAPPQSSSSTAVATSDDAEATGTEAAPAAPPPVAERKKSNNSSAFASLWAAPDDAEGFKPTRKVRERPGGKDSISGLFN